MRLSSSGGWNILKSMRRSCKGTFQVNEMSINGYIFDFFSIMRVFWNWEKVRINHFKRKTEDSETIQSKWESFEEFKHGAKHESFNSASLPESEKIFKSAFFIL